MADAQIKNMAAHMVGNQEKTSGDGKGYLFHNGVPNHSRSSGDGSSLTGEQLGEKGCHHAFQRDAKRLGLPMTLGLRYMRRGSNTAASLNSHVAEDVKNKSL
jgi:hypothetical protein